MLSKAISTKDFGKFVNVIKSYGIKSLKDNEKHLKNNCEMLAKRVDKHRQILPLAEKITAMKISMVELLVFDDAVSGTAEQYNLPISSSLSDNK